MCLYAASDGIQKEIGQAVVAHALDLIQNVSWTSEAASTIATVAQSLAKLPLDDDALDQVSNSLLST